MRVLAAPAARSRPAELQETVAVERDGVPFLLGRDGDGQQRIWVLEPQDERLWIGRGAACDVALEWDEQASRAHAELIRVAGGWAVSDDGLSRNGTWVEGERVSGRRRLHDGEALRVGQTSLTFRAPGGSGTRTGIAADRVAAPELTPMQRRVLVSLCRPLLEGAEPALPASNQAIADELFLSVEAVKTHMRALFQKFGVEALPHSRKRVRLAELARRAGLL